MKILEELQNIGKLIVSAAVFRIASNQKKTYEEIAAGLEEAEEKMAGT